MQHGLTGQEALITMLQSAAISRTPAFVRVPWNTPGDIMRALDAGAQGVIVPMITSAADARAAVGACRYAPQGYRSWGPTRNALYSSTMEPMQINTQVICVAMVETIEAIEALDSILDVPGIDAIFVGPSDLAVSMGIEPSLAGQSRDHEELVNRVLQGCRKRGIVAGIFCGGAESARGWREAGFRMLAVQSDARLLRAACDALVRSIRETPGDTTFDSPAAYV